MRATTKRAKGHGRSCRTLHQPRSPIVATRVVSAGRTSSRDGAQPASASEWEHRACKIATWSGDRHGTARCKGCRERSRQVFACRCVFLCSRWGNIDRRPIVATASYRLLPKIILNPEKPVPAHLAEKFKNCFSQGVIKIDPRTKQVSVNEARRETMSREVYRHPEFEGCVQLARVRDHFLCEPFAPLRCLI